MRLGKDLRFRESVLHLKKNTPLTYTFISEKEVAISASKFAVRWCGVVTTLSGEPIIGALIQTSTKNTITDEDGFFEIEKKRNNTLFIQFPGYENLKIEEDTFDDKNCPTIRLRQEVQTLSEVVITNYIAKGIDQKNDGSIDVNFSKMGILPGVIEADVLLTTLALPGVQSVNERISDLNIRGGTHDQNLFLWDDIKMYQSGHFFGLISAFNPNLTEEVSIYKNGTPVRYTDGVSGTLSMRSSSIIQQQVKAALEVNLINAGGFIDVPLGEKSSLQLSARKSLSDILETPTYSQYFDRIFQDTEVIQTNTNTQTETDEELFSFYDSSLRWIYQPTEKDRIQVNALVVGNDLSFRESAVINNIRERQRSSIIQNNLAGGISYTRTWNDTFTTYTQLYGSNYTLEGTNFDLINNQRLIQTNDVLEDGLRLEGIFAPLRRKQWLAGYQFNETGITNIQDINNPQFKRSVKEVIRSHGLYASYDYISPKNGIRIIAGIRGQYYDKLKTFSFEPRITYSQRLFENLTINLAAERKSQATSQTIDFQSDFLGIESRRWILANNGSVPLIESMQASAGLSYSKKRWLVSAETYFKKVEGITVRSQGFQNQLQFVRGTGAYEVKGLELLIHKQWDNFNFRTGYSLTMNEYFFDPLPSGISLNFPNAVDVRQTIKSAIGYSNDRFSISTGVNWHSGRPFTPLDTGTPVSNNGLNFQTPNNARLPDYLRWDVATKYLFPLGSQTKGEVALSIWNLLGSNNTLDRYFLLSDQQPTTIEERALGFTPNLSFKILFQ